MWQSLFIGLVLAISLFFIGRKLYRQFKIAIDPKEKIRCGCGCSGCSSQGASSKTSKTAGCPDHAGDGGPKP
jgi:hypothetical protein